MQGSRRLERTRTRAPARLLPARLALAGGLLFLASCGGPQPSIAVSLAGDVLQVSRGGQSTVEVTLTRLGGASADVTLEVTGLPDEVQAALSPAVLAGDVLTSTLTFSADAAADEGVHILTVSATGTGLAAEAQLVLEVESFAVTGRLNGILGAPMSDVILASQGDTTVTDEDGSFRLAGLSLPYDVTAWIAASQQVHVYRGLTEGEVELSSFVLTASSPSRSATINGSVTGGSVPVGANQVIRVCAEGLDGYALDCLEITPGNSSFSFSVSWQGKPERTVRLHALEIETDPGGEVVGYPGYGSVEVELTDGETVNLSEPIDLGSALDTEEVELTVVAPETPSLTVAAVQVGPNMALTVMRDDTGATDFSLVMPVIPGAGYVFASGDLFDQAAWVTGATGGSVTVTVPELPTLTEPADLATDVTTATEFTVANTGGGAVTWTWEELGVYRAALTTTATTVTIPDTSELGIPLPAGHTLQWRVVASGGDGV